jgi:hypothetical protein
MNRSPLLRSIFAILMFWRLSHSCFCASDPPVPGHVEAWGDNSLGKTSIPDGLDGVIAIAAGYTHSLALLTNGTVVAWGYNLMGQTTVPANLTNVVAIAASTHSVALKRDGTVVIWGSNDPAVTAIPPNLTGVIGISAGSAYTVALLTNRTIVAWGTSFAGQTNVPPGLDNVIDVSAGRNHVLTLKSDGSIVGWGLNDNGQATHPPGLTGVAAVRAGQFTSFAIKTDGTIFKWGANDDTDPPPGVGGLVDLRLGDQHVIGLRSDGTVVAWGHNGWGEGSVPPGLNGVTAIAAGGNFNLVLTRRPLVTEISGPVIANVGATVTFTVKASGSPLSYQWQHKGSNLPQETNSSITLANVQPADAGDYSVVVSNPYGTISPSTLLSFPPPQISTQPKDLTLYRGETATFKVVADGLTPFAYQWRKSDIPLPGATSSNLNLVPMSTADSGSYSVVVTDAAGGSVTSMSALLQVIDPRLATSVLTPAIDTSFFSSGINPRGITILVGTRNNRIVDRGLLHFDLSSIPAAAVIQSARLQLTVVMVPRLPAADSNFSLYRMLTPWDADATWANATAATAWAGPGTLAGVDYAGSASATQFITGTGPYEFGPSADLVADLQAWRTNSTSNNGWLLKCESEDTRKSARHFGSSESTSPPRLVIDYSLPLPAPTLTQLQLQSTNLTFQVSGTPGWIYAVERRDIVDRGAWIEITNVPAGPATNSIFFSLPLRPPQGFYRVRTK